MSKSINWEQHKYGAPVPCTFTPRQHFAGRPLKPDLSNLSGLQLQLNAMWLMDQDDKYPGEWALGVNYGRQDALPGITWIASGDVTPC